MAQHFEPPAETLTGTDPALRAQRMTADESRAVIALWQSERVEATGLTDKPAVPDVAEGLEVSLEDVQRLLTEVRARRVEEERALIAEQELSEIRLAEEERKLAEVRRQRAELRREQAEAERREISRPQQTARVKPFVPVDLPPRYRRDTGDARVKLGGLVAGFVLVLVLYNGAAKHISFLGSPPPRLHVTHASASYGLSGQVSDVAVTCADDAGQDAPCNAVILTSERAYFQETHDKELADAKRASEKKQGAKKNL